MQPWKCGWHHQLLPYKYYDWQLKFLIFKVSVLYTKFSFIFQFQNLENIPTNYVHNIKFWPFGGAIWRENMKFAQKSFKFWFFFTEKKERREKKKHYKRSNSVLHVVCLHSFERLRLRAEVAAEILTHVTNPTHQTSDSCGPV